MSRKKQKPTGLSRQSVLMQRILEVRFTDLEEEKRLCKKLLELSEAEQYLYGSAFANVYLLDSHLALGEYSSCDFYLARASALCKEYGFDDLMLVLCNSAGLYYQKLNDDQTALGYFLEGLQLAEKQEGNNLADKLYNNVGYSFGCNGDLEMVKKYCELALQTIESHLEGENIDRAIVYLCNLAETNLHLGNTDGGRQMLERCDALSRDDRYSRVRLGCTWCAFYAKTGDKKRCVEYADKLIETELAALDDQFFVCDMAEGLCGNMLIIGDHARARRVLDIIQKMEYNSSIAWRFRIQCLKIKCWKAFGETDKLDEAYKEYYEIVMKLALTEDETHVQSMISKILIGEAKQEREQMRRQMRELENVGQLDELTGLYNRRYFNKLVSKTANRAETHTLGFIMLDVDYFKQYNDYYGHFLGDDALRAVAGVLLKEATEGISVSRYGGDEFVCLCINLQDDEVENYVKRVLASLQALRIPHEKNPKYGVLSISMGYCNEPLTEKTDFDKLLNLADKALYEAKEVGRGGYMRKRLY